MTNWQTYHDKPSFSVQRWPTVEKWCNDIIEYIREQGVFVNENCRIQKHRRLLATVAKDSRLSNASSTGDVVLALSDIFQLWNVVATVRQMPFPPELASKLKTVLQDAASLTEPSKPSPGRDVQFELFVWACLDTRHAPTLLDPPGPDFGVTVEEVAFRIEAKRPRSLGALKDRSREGVNQIAKTGIPGVLVTDITKLIACEILAAATPDAAGKDLQDRMHKFVQDNESSLVTEKMLASEVICWSSYAECMYLVDGNLIGPFGSWYHYMFRQDDDPRELLVARIFAPPHERMARISSIENSKSGSSASSTNKPSGNIDL